MVLKGNGCQRVSREEVFNGGGSVYLFIDPKNGLPCYVGITREVRSRRAAHFAKLRAGKHYNQRLQRVFSKRLREGYGELRFGVIEQVPHGLGERERYWIKHWREQVGNRLCNLTSGGEKVDHVKHTRIRLSGISKDKWRDAQYVQCWTRATDERWAKHYGMTVEAYREWKVKRPKPTISHTYLVNKAKCAERRRKEAEERAMWATLTPLTHKGRAFLPLNHHVYAIITATDWEKTLGCKWYLNGNKVRKATKSKQTITSIVGYRPRVISPSI